MSGQNKESGSLKVRQRAIASCAACYKSKVGAKSYVEVLIARSNATRSFHAAPVSSAVWDSSALRRALIWLSQGQADVQSQCSAGRSPRGTARLCPQDDKRRRPTRREPPASAASRRVRTRSQHDQTVAYDDASAVDFFPGLRY